jgi:hypothetical protein
MRRPAEGWQVSQAVTEHLTWGKTKRKRKLLPEGQVVAASARFCFMVFQSSMHKV